MTSQYDQARNLNQNGYVVPKEAINFRKIARIMTERGWTMNHGTVRIITYKAMRRLLTYAIREATGETNPNTVKASVNGILASGELQEALADVLRQAWSTK